MAAKKSSWRWKNTGISVETQVIKKLPKNPKNMNGMKKGQGQLPAGFTTGVSGGGAPAAEGLEFAAMLLNLSEEAPAIEDITDQQPVNKEADPAAAADPSNPVPVDGAQEEAADRYVQGAHLVYKKQIDAADFEELWIYSVDPQQPEDSGKILKSILSGTDIPENKSRSDDGKQSYDIWTAGNAQYVRITGLSN